MLIALLTRYTKSCQNCSFTWKECLLATWGDSKGSICLLLCKAFINEFQLVDKNIIGFTSSKFKVRIVNIFSFERKTNCSVSNLNTNNYYCHFIQFYEFNIYSYNQNVR